MKRLGPKLGQMRPNLSIDELPKLGEELFALMQSRRGATVANIAAQPALMRLLVAHHEARSGEFGDPSDLVVAHAVRRLVLAATRDIASRYPGDDYGMAARVWLALERGTEGLSLADRRKRAKAYTNQEVRSAAKIRKARPSLEQDIMEQVADKLIDREVAHLDYLVHTRLPAAENDANTLRPHAAIYRARTAVEFLWSRLETTQYRRNLYCSALAANGPDGDLTKLHEQSYSQSLDYGLCEMGRLFLAVDYATADTIVTDPENLVPREVIENLWLAQPLAFDEVSFLARAYAEGERQRQPSYGPWFPIPDGFDPKEASAYREHRMVVRWVIERLLETDREKILAIRRTWEKWTECDCEHHEDGMRVHKPDCTIPVAIKSLQFYQQCLDAAWQLLQEALMSPSPASFTGWENGPRVYYELGLPPQ
jgi:hypothetical protein